MSGIKAKEQYHRRNAQTNNCLEVHVLPEGFLCLEVNGGVLTLGGEPMVKTTFAGLLEPGARLPPPAGGTG